jgi:hypothetical protein
VPTYRLHDTPGDDLGLLEHPAPNLEPGDVVALVELLGELRSLVPQARLAFEDPRLADEFWGRVEKYLATI